MLACRAFCTSGLYMYTFVYFTMHWSFPLNFQGCIFNRWGPLQSMLNVKINKMRIDTNTKEIVQRHLKRLLEYVVDFPRIKLMSGLVLGEDAKDSPGAYLSYWWGFRSRCKDYHKWHRDWCLQTPNKHFQGLGNTGSLGTKTSHMGRICLVPHKLNPRSIHDSTRTQMFLCCHSNHQSADSLAAKFLSGIKIKTNFSYIKVVRDVFIAKVG